MQHRVLVSATTNGAVTCDAVLQGPEPDDRDVPERSSSVVAADGSLACVDRRPPGAVGDPRLGQGRPRRARDRHRHRQERDVQGSPREAERRPAGDDLRQRQGRRGDPPEAVRRAVGVDGHSGPRRPREPRVADPGMGHRGRARRERRARRRQRRGPAGGRPPPAPAASSLPLPATHASVIAGARSRRTRSCSPRRQGAGVCSRTSLAPGHARQPEPRSQPRAAPRPGSGPRRRRPARRLDRGHRHRDHRRRPKPGGARAARRA